MRRILILIAVLAGAAVLAAGELPSARATTGPGYQFIVGVRLKNTGVGFTRQHIPRGSSVQFYIKNLSAQERWFLIGGRKTKLLKPSQHEIFFLGFEYRGKFQYRSWGPKAKQFSGTFVVT